MELTPMHKRVIALDVHQAKITAFAVVEHDDGRVEVTKRDFGAFKREVNTSCPPRRSCVRRKQRPPAAVDNSAPMSNRQGSTYRSQFRVQTDGATSLRRRVAEEASTRPYPRLPKFKSDSRGGGIGLLPAPRFCNQYGNCSRTQENPCQRPSPNASASFAARTASRTSSSWTIGSTGMRRFA